MALYGISWDIIGGHIGQFALGHALFLGLGTYVTGLLCAYAGMSPLISIPITVILGITVAVLTGFPSLRLSGLYFMFVSFAWPSIATGLVYYFSSYTGADSGLRIPGLFPFLSYSLRYTAQYLVTLLTLVISALVVYQVTHRSRIGLAFVSILDDEVGSQACGINITKYKLVAFAMSGCLGTLAGALLGHSLMTANPSIFDMGYTFLPIFFTVIGGIGTIYGAIMGAYLMILLDNFVLSKLPPNLAPARIMIYSIVTIALLIKYPGGIARYLTKLVQWFGRVRAKRSE
jgi:branched-chain amino acid transport system permease protein